MNNKNSKLIALLILVAVWYCSYNPWSPGFVLIDNRYIGRHISGCLTVLALGLSYSLLHKKNYPVQAILAILIAEFIVIESKSDYYYLASNSMQWINVHLGTVLVVAGEYSAKFFCSTLSPLQNFLKSIGIKVTIPAIAATLFVPIGLLSTEILRWWVDVGRFWF